jgi:hypothetical protein
MAIAQIGNDIAAATMGGVVGWFSEWITDRIRVHRGELGAPDTGPGSGKFETLPDLTMDSFCQIIFVLLGCKFTESALPAVTRDLSCMILFIMGVSTQTTLPRNLKKIVVTLQQQPDPMFVANAPTSSSNLNKTAVTTV